MEAVKKLIDQSLLVDIAKNDKASWVRKTAVEKLTNQAVLADLAKNDSDGSVREAAAKKIFDKTMLTNSKTDNMSALELFDFMTTECAGGFIC